MRVLVLHSHPLEESFGRALCKLTCESLENAGHEVDGCNLYEEGFDPVLSAHDRRVYHDIPDNLSLVQPYVERLRKAEALVIVSPVWNFGFPAMLKGYFVRVWLPGVSFDLVDGKLTPTLRHIRKLAAVMTYGATPMRAFLPKSSASYLFWNASRRPSRVASGNASPWAARSCATHRSSCLTSPCPTSMPNCVCR